MKDITSYLPFLKNNTSYFFMVWVMQLDGRFHVSWKDSFLRYYIAGKEPATKQIEMNDPLSQSYHKRYIKASCFIQTSSRCYLISEKLKQGRNYYNPC